ncbi:hypothetical protein TNCT_683791 [Trichonephila clavata]|uniref:Uncharacterized protein n=1 Tax=Trichonephila clavata TaxID=2740835 RepID=A0A8X6GUB9_TRICU|nr:hypothetical protein TNCT_683791 [Trichonephila clavata]
MQCKIGFILQRKYSSRKKEKNQEVFFKNNSPRIHNTQVLKMENFDIDLENLTQDGINLMSVCDRIRAARRAFKARVETMMFFAAYLQGLICSSQEEFMSAFQGSISPINLCLKISQYVQGTTSLQWRIRRARNFLSGKVDHPEFLPPATEDFKNLTSMYLLAAIEVNTCFPSIIDRCNNE